MEKIKAFLKSYWQKIGYALLAFALPILCCLAIFGCRGVIVRGNASLFTSQFAETLLSRIAAVKDMGGALLSMGQFEWNGDLLVLIAGILPVSPVNAALVAFMICASITSLSFYLSMRGMKMKEFPALLCALLYSLNGYAFIALLIPGASSLLLMLPLVLTAEYWLIQGKKSWPFALLLSLAFLLDVRSAWIALIAILAWFFYDVFGYSEKPLKKQVYTLSIRFGIGVLIALAVGFSTFLAGFSSLSFNPAFSENANFDILSFFTKMMPGIYDGIRADSLPYVYFGLLPILVLPLYFTAKEITKREKIASAILLLGIFVSMMTTLLGAFVDLFGQGALPVYAQTALFGLVALFLAARTLSLTHFENHSPIFIAYGFLSFLLVIAQKMSLAYYAEENKMTAEYPIDAETIWITLFILTVLVFALHAFLRKNKKRTSCLIAVALLATVAIEAVFGQVKLLKAFQGEYPYYQRDELSAYYEAYTQSVKAIESEMEKGYRYEKIHSLFAGENKLLGFKGVETLGDTSSLLAMLGGKITEGGVVYQNGLLALDSLLSIRYLAEYHPAEPEEDEETIPEKEKGTLEKIKEALFPKDKDSFKNELVLDGNEVSHHYRYLALEDLFTIHQNTYALSLLSTYGGGLENLDFSFLSQEDLVKDENGNWVLPDGYDLENMLYSPVNRLNAIWSTLYGQEVALFKTFTEAQDSKVLVSPTNCSQSTDSIGQIVYTANTGKTNASVKFSVTVNEEASVWLYLPAVIGKEAEVYVNNKYLTTIHENNQPTSGLISVGKREADTTLSIDVRFKVTEGDDSFYLLTDPKAEKDWASSLLYVAEDETFLNFMNQSNFGEFAVEKQSEDSIVGTLTPANGQTAVFGSILYSENTVVRIDGKKAETYEVAGGFLGFDLPDDQAHRIEIVQKGNSLPALPLVLGIFGSAAVLLLAIYETVGNDKWLALWQKYVTKKEKKED